MSVLLAENEPAARNASAAAEPGAPASQTALWAGRVLSGLAVLFLAFDAIGKVVRLEPVVAGTMELGYPQSALIGIGLVELACLLVYLVPRTKLLGAVLLTGYLGGAVATHVRVDSPLFSHTLFPIYVAALVWIGLWLRDTTVRAVLPLRSPK